MSYPALGVPVIADPGGIETRVAELGEIATTQKTAGNCRECVIRILPARAIVIREKEGPGSAPVDFGNGQRPARCGSEFLLLISGLGSGISGQRVRSRIQCRVSDRVIEAAMRVVNIESAAAEHGHCGPPAGSFGSSSGCQRCGSRSSGLIRG